MPIGRLTRAAVLVALAFPVSAQAANPAPKWNSYDRPAEWVAQIDHTLMVPMRDGAWLGCSIYRPKPELSSPLPDGKFPAILNNIEPYQRWQNDSQNTFLAKHGYVVMSCDARGAKESIAAGPFVDPFGEIEQHDMYDLVEWMAAQPWSNGVVGVGGYSYGAILAYLGAAQRPPHLRAVAARASYANLYKEMVYLGGIRGLDVVPWQVGLVTNTTIAATWRQHPLYDSYWAERVIDTKYDALRAGHVPILDYGGWYDIYPDGETKNYMALRKQTWLVMGPGAHLDASPVPDSALLAWYDHWLMKLPGAPLPDDKVISYEMPQVNGAYGHGWTTFPNWPPPASRPVRMYFNADGTLGTAAGPKGEESYPVNPADGSPNYWYHGYSEADGPADQQAEDRNRVTFTSPPLDHDVVVAGATEVTLRAALSATDGNLVVRLTDVAPSGASILAASGYLKASHRFNHERVVPVEPGTPTTFPVHIWATHWRFPKGHSIRLSVSSGDLPRIEPDAPAGTVDVLTGTCGSYAEIPEIGPGHG